MNLRDDAACALEGKGWLDKAEDDQLDDCWQRCPVRQRCLNEALRLESSDPTLARHNVVYGGHTGAERSRLLQHQKRTLTATPA